MRADESLEIRFLRAPPPEEAQRPDRAGGDRRVRRRGFRAAQGPLRPPAHQPRTAKSGIAASEKRALRIMRKPGLAGGGATRKRRIQKKAEPGGPRLNLAERAFAAGGRNGLRAGGIACLPMREGRPYLAAATGAFSRKVVGWSMSGRIAEKVAIDAIGRAVGREGPPDDGGRAVLRDAERGIGGREELWDEGRGQARHLQVHRALLQ